MSLLGANGRRALTAALVLVALTGGISLLARGGGTPSSTRTLREVDLVASVDSVNVDSDFSMNGPLTRGAVRLVLDDLRTIVVSEGTMVDDHSTVPACTSFDIANSCVLLADMLGDAVVWFALVPADRDKGRERLVLPGLVDMLDNGNIGVLANGWMLRLASPVERECGDEDTANLRDFITRFPDAASTSVVDLVRDEVVRVECAG